MHRGVLAVPLRAPLSQVAETMAKHHVHCVVALGETADKGSSRVWGLVGDLELTRIACTEGLQGRTAAAAPRPSSSPSCPRTRCTTRPS